MRGPSSVPAAPPSAIAPSELQRTIALTFARTRPRQNSGVRLRSRVLASALTVVGVIATPGLVNAAPRHNHHLTIAASPNPVLAGEGVVIYGRLQGAANGGQPIRLYHHLEGSGNGYTLVGTTKTDGRGFYEFTREEGVVYTNRNWFVRGPFVIGAN